MFRARELQVFVKRVGDKILGIIWIYRAVISCSGYLLSLSVYSTIFFLADLSKKDKEKPFSYLDHSGHVVNMDSPHEYEKNQKDLEKHEDEMKKGAKHHNSIADDIDLAMSETKWEFKDKDFSVNSDDDHSPHFDDHHAHTKPKHGHTGKPSAKSNPSQTNQFEVLTSESKGLSNILIF